MNAISNFLSFEPTQRIEMILKARDDFPDDPHPGLRCVSLNPNEEFIKLGDDVSNEISAYIRLLAELGKVHPDDVESLANNAEAYVLALAVIRVKA